MNVEVICPKCKGLGYLPDPHGGICNVCDDGKIILCPKDKGTTELLKLLSYVKDMSNEEYLEFYEQVKKVT